MLNEDKIRLKTITWAKYEVSNKKVAAKKPDDPVMVLMSYYLFTSLLENFSSSSYIWRFGKITLDYQGKFKNILNDLKKDISDLKSDLSGLKSDFSKLEADIQISRKVNSKLSGRLVTMERRCYANEHYSRRERLDISGIPASVADKDLDQKS